jgi:hypothetical protein
MAAASLSLVVVAVMAVAADSWREALRVASQIVFTALVDGYGG